MCRVAVSTSLIFPRCDFLEMLPRRWPHFFVTCNVFLDRLCDRLSSRLGCGLLCCMTTTCCTVRFEMFSQDPFANNASLRHTTYSSPFAARRDSTNQQRQKACRVHRQHRLFGGVVEEKTPPDKTGKPTATRRGCQTKCSVSQGASDRAPSVSLRPRQAVVHLKTRATSPGRECRDESDAHEPMQLTQRVDFLTAIT